MAPHEEWVGSGLAPEGSWAPGFIVSVSKWRSAASGSLAEPSKDYGYAVEPDSGEGDRDWQNDAAKGTRDPAAPSSGRAIRGFLGSSRYARRNVALSHDQR